MSKRLTYEYVKEQIESVEGYKLLSKEYVNAQNYLLVQCDKGHEYEVKWNNWQRGQRCSNCCKYVSGLSFNYIKSQIESVEGYKLLSKSYKNGKTKLKIQCDKKHIYYPIWINFQKGSRCPYCSDNIKKISFNYIKKQIEKEGYKLLSKTYVNNRSKIKIQCDEGHIYKVVWNSFKIGCRCPVCDHNKKSSKAEKEVLKIVKKLTNKNVIENDRTQIINPLTNCNLELDVWIPELKKAIEFNGKYWHSLEEAKIRDKEKIKQCKEKGINLLVIQEQNWMDNKVNEITKIKNWIKGEFNDRKTNS